MLATLVAEPFDAPGWVYEEKYDGDRILAYKEGGRVQLLTRNGIDRTARFPEIAAAIGKLGSRTLLLDGGVVVFDESGSSRFQLLQQGRGKPVYAVFDCLYRDGKDLRREPLKRRQEMMRSALEKGRVLLAARRLSDNGLKAYRQARRKGFEGLVAKDISSPYSERRSRDWRKVKIHLEDEFLIVGFTEPKGARLYFGALLLGAYEKRALRYVGKVGTGFDGKTLAALYRRFRPLIAKEIALTDSPRERDVTYLKPMLVAQISYQELTLDLKLRQPVFLGLRDDKSPQDVMIPLPQR